MPRLRGRKYNAGTDAGDPYSKGWKNWIAQRAVKSASARRWAEVYARRHGWKSLDELGDDYDSGSIDDSRVTHIMDEDVVDNYASGLPVVNLLGDFNAESQFNSMSVRRGTYVARRPEATDTRKRSVVSIGYPSIPRGIGRQLDVHEFLPLTMSIRLGRDIQCAAQSKVWNIESGESWGSIFNDGEMLSRAYAQSIAANGHTAWVDPDAGDHDGVNTDLFNNAMKTGKFAVFYTKNDIPVALRNNAMAASSNDYTATAADATWSGGGMFNGSNNFSDHCRFYLEKYTCTYKIFNSGNSKVTVKFLVVTPRKPFVRGAATSGYVSYPTSMDWHTMMDSNDAADREKVPMYNKTSNSNTMDYIEQADSTSIAPFQAPTLNSSVWYGQLGAEVPSWKDMSGGSLYKHRNVNKFFKVKEVKFTLGPGEQKDVTVWVPPQIVDLQAAWTNYLPHLNFKVYVLSRGELCTGSATNDIGYSAGCLATRTMMTYRVRYCRPPKAHPMKWKLGKNDLTGNGEIWNEVTGAEEAVDTTN
jgi:hypothetical protein